MGLFFKLIILYFFIRFIIRIVLPTATIYNQVKKRADDLHQKVNDPSSSTEKSLYESKGEYIEFEEMN